MNTQAQETDRTLDVLANLRPEWAKALIVAELEEDNCDYQSDYFNTKTVKTVALAWSRHTKDLFSEMRKAAATFAPTKHLGPGCDLYTPMVVLADSVVTNGGAYWKDSPSHWHSELQDRYDAATFATLAEAEAFVAAKGAPHAIGFQTADGLQEVQFAWTIARERIEHREKYSMGHGYYLKAASRYSSGWTVRKVDPAWHTIAAVDVSILKG